MARELKTISIRPDELAALDTLAAEAGCSRADLVRVSLRLVLGSHPRDVQRRVADLPADGRRFNPGGSKPKNGEPPSRKRAARKESRRPLDDAHATTAP